MSFTSKFAEDYLEWRNDPSTRKWGRIGKKITPKTHMKWLAENTIMPITYSHDCGTAYLKVKDDEAEFSIVVDPKVRRVGVGFTLMAALIALAEKYRFRRIYGQTKKNNPAFKLFKKMGFKEYKREGPWVWIEIIL